MSRQYWNQLQICKPKIKNGNFSRKLEWLDVLKSSVKSLLVPAFQHPRQKCEANKLLWEMCITVNLYSYMQYFLSIPSTPKRVQKVKGSCKVKGWLSELLHSRFCTKLFYNLQDWAIWIHLLSRPLHVPFIRKPELKLSPTQQDVAPRALLFNVQMFKTLHCNGPA